MKTALSLSKETDRLLIRFYEKSDFPNWHESMKQRMPSQQPFDDGRPTGIENYTSETFSAWVEKDHHAAEKDYFYHLGIFRKQDGVHIGKIELFTILRMDYQWGMMGYSIHNQFWRQEYGMESVKAASELFFNVLGFHRLELHIHPDNAPSLQLAEKAGFRLECRRESFSLENGVWSDMLIYYLNNNLSQ
ncbi:GNAT family N-acetyltransferase [Bacillus sp. 1P06AnD]|uniref:GNAT family N-acetyltransferase n=1 Tax=Bacillus sp. 1P06AnD TaxID=3132208 RepID=UPI0039A164ED